jgi:hypothetical protein
MRYLSKHNLLRWFLEDHRTLPESYKKSCKKFFKEISDELQASSNKRQAASNKPVDKLINKG